MKFSFQFSNLLGSVYRRGNLAFTPDGGCVISPVGNRITVFDLKNNKSETLPIESSRNITHIATSPDGYTLILVNEEGEALLCSLISRSVLHRFHFHGPVHSVKFSPDGKKFAVAKGDKVLLYSAPCKQMNFNPFRLLRTLYGAYDDNVCIDWSSDSRVLCVGSKDMSTRVYGAIRFKNLIIYTVGGHSDSIVGAFFEKDSMNLYTIAANGIVNYWECNTGLDGLESYRKENQKDAEDVDEEQSTETQKRRRQEEEDDRVKNKIIYKKGHRCNLKLSRDKGTSQMAAKLTSVAFHKLTNLLVTGFEDGCFFIHEMPVANLIHSLSISDQLVGAVEFNKTGDWIAMGCCGLGQLLVWEWQSETYILKQQGHFNNMTCLQYSPDGQFIATGGDDAKVKVWNVMSGSCFVTFSEHTAGITGVTFNQQGQVVLSSSLDGTVRAFDLNRYRNFRTFTSPQAAQFSCLTVDPSGEIVCAGTVDSFEIYVWSMKTGRLLDVLSGHEAPISDLSFSPSRALLASGSWDKTVKLWDIFENKGARETLTLNADVLALAFRPDGGQLAVATLNASITFWDSQSAVQTGSIEGRHDLGYFRKLEDKITAKKSAAGQAFNTICYSADGKAILAAGRSKNVCIYSVEDQILMKKFEISCNKSFDGMEEFLDKRQMTEWGNIELIDDEEEDGTRKSISLPGVLRGDMSSRHWKAEVRVCCIRFSPTGRAWAATSTEGLLVYSLDHSLTFDPFELEVDITPDKIRHTLKEKDYSAALMLSFRLNEHPIIQEVLEQIPLNDVLIICQNLHSTYVDKLLFFISGQIEQSAHIQYYLTWLEHLLVSHGPALKQRSASIMATLRSIQKATKIKYDDIGKICEHNEFTMQYLLKQSHLKRKRAEENSKSKGSSDNDENDEGMESESEDDSGVTDSSNIFVSKWSDDDSDS
ncbi:periodic tryptophan protein 2 homolog isoform X2 [Octopus sinensis]|uniref:Periodic tryptophan protein 2 homolog isoform X2 n=1 Tax=Octopus sinensis TaxID=2607531 RepID=A0A6P7T238_9MOLL|nr:periodic tryptophan protein 2 homolog isoform X2 [Octopus sinensis]XP_036364124.1 periodic tryptophan protein 2 homolog isoform X2 [Octopus sinensis]